MSCYSKAICSCHYTSTCTKSVASYISLHHLLDADANANLKQPSDKIAIKPSSSITIRLLLSSMSQESLLFAIDFVFSGVKVSLVGPNHFRLHEEFVAEDADEVDWYALRKVISKRRLGSGINSMRRTYEIASDKSLGVERAIFAFCEGGEILGQSDQTAEEQCDVGASEAKRSRVGHLVLCDALGTTSADEEDVRNEERNPGQESKDGGQVDKVDEDDSRVVGCIEEG